MIKVFKTTEECLVICNYLLPVVVAAQPPPACFLEDDCAFASYF